MSSSTNNRHSDHNRGGSNNNNNNNNSNNNNNNNSNNNNHPFRRSKSNPDDSSNGTGTDANSSTLNTTAYTTALLGSNSNGIVNADHLPLMQQQQQRNADGTYSYNIEDMSLIALLSRVNSLSSVPQQLPIPSFSSSSSLPPSLLVPTSLDNDDPTMRVSQQHHPQRTSYMAYGEELLNDESSSTTTSVFTLSPFMSHTTGSVTSGSNSSSRSSSIPFVSHPQSPSTSSATATASLPEHQLTLLRNILDMATLIGSISSSTEMPQQRRNQIRHLNHTGTDMPNGSDHHDSMSPPSNGKLNRRRHSFPPRQ